MFRDFRRSTRRTLAAITMTLCLGLLGPSADAECNTAPVAVDDAGTTLYEQQFDVLLNDSDADSQLLTVSIDSTTCPGEVSVDFGLITLKPTLRLYDDCIIEYTIEDELGATDSATVQVSMTYLPPEIFADGFEAGTATAWDLVQ